MSQRRTAINWTWNAPRVATFRRFPGGFNQCCNRFVREAHWFSAISALSART